MLKRATCRISLRLVKIDPYYKLHAPPGPAQDGTEIGLEGIDSFVAVHCAIRGDGGNSVAARAAEHRPTWIHAVSVGEVAIALKLAAKLKKAVGV